MVDKQQINKDAQAAYKARMRADGFKLIALWIKTEHVDKVKAYVKALNAEGEG
jgi:hypothetical protein